MLSDVGDALSTPRIIDGTIVGDTYRLVEKIGEGGMSTVFLAEERDGARPFAVKFLKCSTSSFTEDKIRFRNELALVSNLDHPNIVKVFDAGEQSGVPYIVLERLEGGSLEDLLEGGTSFSIDEVMDIAKQLLDALAYVHGYGILHRDIKPGNVFLVQRPDGHEVKLFDFGVSLVMELADVKDEEIAGTFGYMSPEATGILRRTPDERSDLYSLGIILYRLLTGELPFAAESMSKLVHEQVALAPKKPSLRNRAIPEILDAIVLKLLDKEPDFRYQSAKGLLYDIERYREGERDFIPAERDQKIKLSFHTRLVGRDAEIRDLTHLVDEAERGRGSSCFISGESGYGKTKLADTLREQVRERGGVFFSGKCLSQENKVPYQPFLDILHEWVRHLESLGSDERTQEIDRLRAAMGDFLGIVLRLSVTLEPLFGTVKKAVELEPERDNQRFLMVLAEFFLHLAGNGRPCVLFLDDLQSIDEGSAGLLREMLGSVGSSHVLLLGAFRDDEVGEQHTLRSVLSETGRVDVPVLQMRLTPFDSNVMNRFLSVVLCQPESATYRITGHVFGLTNGNPFFALRVLRNLVEERALTWKNDAWEEDWDKIRSIPASADVVDMILKRTNELSAEVCEVLSVCAAIGTEFETELLFGVLKQPESDVVAMLDTARSLQMVEPWNV